jgi:hypothetical protein
MRFEPQARPVARFRATARPAGHAGQPHRDGRAGGWRCFPGAMAKAPEPGRTITCHVVIPARAYAGINSSRANTKAGTNSLHIVIPAKAGIRSSFSLSAAYFHEVRSRRSMSNRRPGRIPAFAGMTKVECNSNFLGLHDANTQ